eukprot:TRINITY_DN23880_c0_g1_i1.p1 TRINITY_DN23880_c0_g1~~TRINITY_DN23880_c0_g1_i1.p1  ORF type:complete len:123 (-),score=13.51 TRINITY_DN23880_c0_g1_i1:9-326(-)
MAAGLTYPKPLAGIACLSGWLPTCIPLKHEARNPCHVLWQHGGQDDCVLPCLQDVGVARLKNAGVDVTCIKHREGGHVPGQQEISDLQSWICDILSSRSQARNAM